MILLDTNVVSEFFKPEPSAAVLAWVDSHFEECAISSLLILELEIGVGKLDAGRRRSELESAVSRIVRRFGTRVYAFDAASAHAAAVITERARRDGTSLHQLPAKLIDLQIAGIALAYGLTLATRNTRDFRDLGLELADPWAG